MRDDLAQGVRPYSTRVMNLCHLLTESARRHRDAPALIWGDRQWSWAQMEARACALAQALRQDYGLQKGDRLLVQSANCNQMLEALFACWRIGAVWVPANFRLPPAELAGLADPPAPAPSSAARASPTTPPPVLRMSSIPSPSAPPLSPPTSIP